jgi:hypothetical protein
MNRFDNQVSKQQLSSLINASYQGTNAGAKTAEKEGFKMDSALSNRKHKVFTDAENNPHVVFTGTRTLGDVITDGALAVGLGRFTNRFQDSKKLVQKVKNKYNKPVTASGHSLGGSLAEYSGADKIITLDKGAGLGDIGRKIKKNQTDIRTGTDPVSLLSLTQTGGKHITIPKTNYANLLYSHDKSHLTKAKQRFF